MLAHDFPINLIKKCFRLKPVTITAFTFLIIAALYNLPFSFAPLNPISEALVDFDFNDIIFSRLRPEQNADTNIVLVNIGNLSRREIADEITWINNAQPAVIGIDAFFSVPKDTNDDLHLMHAMSQVKNLVLVHKVCKYDSLNDEYKQEEKSIPLFNKYAANGFANLPDNENGAFRTIRKYRPSVLVNGTSVPSFTSQVIARYDPGALQILKDRGNDLEIINFRGNMDKFFVIDASVPGTVPSPEFIKGKIVLMGFMGRDIASPELEDKFYTPLNSRPAGKTYPDMYGIVVHANIASMVLNNSYINEVKPLFSVLFAVLISYLNVILLIWLKAKIPAWLSIVTKLFLFIQTIFYLSISVWLFSYFRVKISLTLVLAAIALSTTSIDLFEVYFVKSIELVRKRKSRIRHENI